MLSLSPSPHFFLKDVTVNEFEYKSKIDDLQSQLTVAEASHQAEMEKNNSYLEEINSLKQHIKLLESKSVQFESLQKEAEGHKLMLRELDILREENVRLRNDLQNLSSVVCQTCLHSIN